MVNIKSRVKFTYILQIYITNIYYKGISMGNNVNRRTKNLAEMNDEKREEDEFMQNSLFGASLRYFSPKRRKKLKIIPGEKGWKFSNTNKPLSTAKKRYMYVVGENGGLYLDANTKYNIGVHSQFKEGRDVQSAGYISYEKTASGLNIKIDNDSGHYTPTLSQLLSTVYGLYKRGFLPEQFNIAISPYTKLDYPSGTKSTEFWENAKDAGIKNTVSVNYSKESDGFVFTHNSKSITMNAEKILANGGFEANNHPAIKPMK